MEKDPLELINEARTEQIEKHGYSVQFHFDNPQWYNADQLLQAASFCVQPKVSKWPDGWKMSAADKIAEKPRIEQLAIAGAFILTQEQIFGATRRTKQRMLWLIDEINSHLKQQ